MAKIPYIKIPSVRVGSIGPTSNIGAGGATPAPPVPITYLTQWKMMGNSEVHGQEIWSCGEYSEVDGKYHILVQPQGGSIADIALDEPLRKVDDVADTIEFVDGVGTLTRNFASALLSDVNWYKSVVSSGKYRYDTSGFKSLDKPIKSAADNAKVANVLCSIYDTISANKAYTGVQVGISVERTGGKVYLYDSNYDQNRDYSSPPDRGSRQLLLRDQSGRQGSKLERF